MNISDPNNFSNELCYLLPQTTQNLKEISISTTSNNFNTSNPSNELELLEQEIKDPDLRLAIQFQREELEKELLRKKQQREDEEFALQLQNQVDNDSPPINTDLKNSSSLAVQSPIYEIKNFEDDETCVVCLNDERNSVFVPCAHRSCCKDCAKRIYRKKGFCPLCWMTLEGVIDCEKIPEKN